MATISIPVIARGQVAKPGRRNLETVRESSGLGELTRGLQNVGEGMDRRQDYADHAAEKAKAAERDMDRARAAEKVSQAQLDWTQSELDRRSTYDVSSGKPYTAAVLKDFDAYIEKTTQGAASEFEKRMLRGQLTTLRSTIGSSAMKFEAQARGEYKLKSLATSLDRRVATATIDPSQAVDLIAQHLGELDSTELLTPEDRRAHAVAGREALSEAALRTMAARDPDAVLRRLGVRGKATGKDGKPGASDVQQGLAALAGDPLASSLSAPKLRQLVDDTTALSETRRQKAEHQALIAQYRAEIAAAKRERVAESAFRAAQGLVDSGAIPDSTFMARVQADTNPSPVWAAAMKDLVATAAEDAGFATLPPAQQEATLLQLRAHANAKGSNPALEKRLGSLQRIATSSAEQLKDEPLAYGAKRRMFELKPIEITTIDDLAEQLRQGPRVEQASTIEARTGRASSPLLKSEAHRVADLVAALPAQQRARAMRQLGQVMPPAQQQQLGAQMHDKSQAMAYAMYAATVPGPPDADVPMLILRGDDAVKAKRLKPASDDATVGADRLRIAREIDRVAWSTPASRDAAAAAAGLIHDGLRDMNNGGSANWRKAVELATGGLAQWGDKLVPVPPGMDERRFTNAMRNVDAVSIAGQQRGPLFVNGLEVRTEDLAKAFGAMTMIPVGPGRYALETGGAMVTNADRSRFVFTLRD